MEAGKSVVRLQLGKSFDLRVRINEKRIYYIIYIYIFII